MKKILISILALGLSLVIKVNAQSVVDSNDLIQWQPNNPVVNVVSYNVALTPTSVTSPTTNNAVSFINVAGGGSTNIVASSLIPSSTPTGNYNIFVQAVGANGLTSAWSAGLLVQYVVAPNAPSNIIIIRQP